MLRVITRRRCNKWEDRVRFVAKEKLQVTLSATQTTIIEQLGRLTLEVLKLLSMVELRESKFAVDVYVQVKLKELYN